MPDNHSDFLPLAKPRLNLRRLLFYFITLAALVLIYLKFSEIELIKEVFLRSNLLWLIGIIVTQFLSYLSLAFNYRDVLRVKDLAINVWKLLPMTFVIQFINQALPSANISGQAFFIQYLKRYGLTIAEGIGRAIIELVTLCVAFGVFFLISSILMFQNGALAAQPAIAYFIYLFVFVGLIFGIVFVALQSHRRGAITRWVIAKLHQYFEKRGRADHSQHAATILDQLKTSLNIGELGKRKRAFWAATFWQGMMLLFNVFSLYFISFAIGYPINFSVAFIAFILTKFLSMIAFVPGALGIFEGGMTLILVSFGIPAQTSFALTLLFRAFSFWFPLPIGWIMFKYISHRQELEQPQS